MITRDFPTECRRQERRLLLELTKKRKPTKQTAGKPRRADVVYLVDKR